MSSMSIDSDGAGRAAMHHAMWDYFPHRRLGYRVTVRGDRPFLRA